MFPFKNPGVIKTEAPSNIALVKYWGKKMEQLPQNPSISFSLSKSRSYTDVKFSKKTTSGDDIELSFIFDGKTNEKFEKRILNYLTRIRLIYPWVDKIKWEIHTSNTFPHSCGIASSASSMASLSLALVKMNELIEGKSGNEKEFLKKASGLARLGSGSACRSLYGPVSLWGNMPEIIGSSDEFAVEISEVHKNFLNFNDTILVLDRGPKEISSTKGHELMENHPFSKQRFDIARENCVHLLQILKEGDLLNFISLVEREALMLHGLMMTSKTPFVLIKPNTLSAISQIKDFRAKTHIPVTFTLDAGPNLHLLYPDSYQNQIHEFISNSLILDGWDGMIIDDKVALKGWSVNVQ